MNTVTLAATTERLVERTPGRRAACPRLRQPMLTGDGLLVRFRPIANRLERDGALALANGAECFGNGLIEITARGGIQVRGVGANAIEPLAIAIEHAIAVESGVPVETPALAGQLGGEVVLELARDVREAIARRGLAERLGPKVTVAIEGAGVLQTGLSADIMVRVVGSGCRISGGGRPVGVAEVDVVAAVIERLGGIADRGKEARGWVSGDTGRPARGASARSMVGSVVLGGERLAVGVVPPFGVLTASQLRDTVALMDQFGVTELRVAAGRGFYFVSIATATLKDFMPAVGDLGLLARSGDPRLAISACSGQGACASGSIATRELGARIAEVSPSFIEDMDLHLSGCAKGCAHPAPATLTVTGREGQCDIALRGRAGAAALLSVSPDAAIDGFGRLEGLFRRRARAQESAAQWLSRLGVAAISDAFSAGRS